MKTVWKNLIMVLAGSLALFCMAGCGVSEKKLKDAEQRMESLQQNGVPDSLLTEAKVLIVQSRTAKQLGNGMGAKTNFDSAMTILAKAEAGYGATTAQTKPFVESLRKALGDKKLNFTGTTLKEGDSLLALVDALVKANKWPDAKSKALEVDTIFTSLQKSLQIAKELRPKLVGTWSGSQAIKEDGANAVEKKSFSFGVDGKISIVEERNGLTNPSLKEDWKFESWGTYDLVGDTILIFVNREKCDKQVYLNLRESGKKKDWVKTEKAPYDSAITGGKKDRYITFDFLKAGFKKK
jgi:hypothetical protein